MSQEITKVDKKLFVELYHTFKKLENEYEADKRNTDSQMNAAIFAGREHAYRHAAKKIKDALHWEGVEV